MSAADAGNRLIRLALDAVILSMFFWGMCGCDGPEQLKFNESKSPAAAFANVPPGGIEAYDLVLEFYGLDSGPAIHWRTDGFTCGGGRGWCDDGSAPPDGVCAPNTTCEDGGYNPSSGYAVVALRPGDAHHTTALAHELGHYLSWARTGDYDAGHTGPVFASGGDVAQAEAALLDAGL